LPPTSTPTLTLTSTLPVTSELGSSAALTFNGETAYQHVLAQVAYGPRPTGSEAGWATGDFILATLEQTGWSAETQEFIFRGVKGRNLIGKLGSGPILILGAHYDTRPAADHDSDPAKRGEWIEGANDGASGVAVLLELARVLEASKLKNEVWLAFFDAEDRGRLEGWPFSVGARHMAENLAVSPQAVVVVDMIGDADQNIYLEQNSTPPLRESIWAVAAELGYEAYLIPQLKHSIIDDHLPFLERGLPAVDIIDFDYPYWHTTADTADKVAPESLERVGRTLEVWLEEKQ
jgi:Zn-dependent M28 family amino/carboxypeptidase